MEPAAFRFMLERLAADMPIVRAWLSRCDGAEAFATRLSVEITAIDRVLSRQMDAILGHADFQALESAWRGLAYLLDELKPHLLPAAHSPGRIRFTAGRPGIRVRILSARRDEWEENFLQAARFDRSHFWTEVYAREFDTAGGEPFGVMLCDYAVGDQASLQLFRDFSRAAMGGFCPVLFRAAPGLFDVRDFSELARRIPDWRPECAADAEDFRRSPEASFAALMIPDIRLREPYRLDSAASWPYREGVDAAGRRGALWGHAGWSYVAAVSLVYVESGWVYSLAADIGVDSAPAPLNADEARPMAAQVYFSSRAAVRLAELGCCAAYAERQGEAVDFIRPATLFRVAAAAGGGKGDALPSGDSLPAILAVSRVAHFLKAATRDQAGSFTAKAEVIGQIIGGWLKEYTNDRDGDLTHPLAKQEVTVRDVASGGPGRFRAEVRLVLKPVRGRRRDAAFAFPVADAGR